MIVETIFYKMFSNMMHRCGCLRYVTMVIIVQYGSHIANAQYWMSMGTQTSAISTSSATKNFCDTLKLHPHQRGVCNNYTDLIPSVAEGIRMSIQECQEQFSNRKWNCSILAATTSIFGPMVNKASRESAFISGITAAGVAHSVTEACAEGRSLHCRCDNSFRGEVDQGWKWGGCNRPIAYGIWFAKLFIDVTEMSTKKKRDPRRAMNLHNNRAGREIIRHNLWTKCKCHGMSGNCNLKTCWLAQPLFSVVGNMLKERYDSAHEMDLDYKQKKNGKKRFKKLVPRFKEYLPPSTLDFIYYENSPDYCEENTKLGIVGTSGRVCNITSSGVDGCEQMCCRRGYNAAIIKETKSCNCKFIWCCHVKCEQCIEALPKYTCK